MHVLFSIVLGIMGSIEGGGETSRRSTQNETGDEWFMWTRGIFEYLLGAVRGPARVEEGQHGAASKRDLEERCTRMKRNFSWGLTRVAEGQHGRAHRDTADAPVKPAAGVIFRGPIRDHTETRSAIDTRYLLGIFFWVLVV